MSPLTSTTTPSNNNNPLALLTQVADALRVASIHGVNLVLFPELFLPNAVPPPAAVTEPVLQSIDRDGYELNIIGNLCAELGVACVMGYAERKHESEGGGGGDDDDAGGVFNSAAIFNCDGSRAGNYRRITSTSTTSDVLGQHSSSGQTTAFLRGHTLVETLPISLCTSTLSQIEKKIKIGVLIGNDVLVAEQCCHVVRSGAEALFVLASFGGRRHETKEFSRISTVVRHLLPTRALEHSVPLLFANYVGTLPEEEDVSSSSVQSDGDYVAAAAAAATDKFSFIGSSTVLDAFGEELVRAPCEEDGDMPGDGGYLLPCEAGDLYAVDLNLDDTQQAQNRNFAMEYAEGWDLSPSSIQGAKMKTNAMEKTIAQKNGSRGFGAAARSDTLSIAGKKQKSEKRKKQKRSKYYPWTG